MKYIYYFLFFSITVVGQGTKLQEYFPFYDNCTDENEYAKCESEILSQQIFKFITPEIENEIISNFKDDMSVLTIAFIYQKNKPIREDIDIDFTNNEVNEQLKKFLLELKPLAKDDIIDDSLRARHFEFVFLKDQANKLYIASNELLKNMNYKSEFKFGTKSYPNECANAIDIDQCTNKYFSNHIVKNFEYPRKAIKNDIQGTVDCKFYINKDGMIVIEKLQGPDQLLEEEAQRILKKLPKFVYGTVKGVPVKFSYSLPITFRLE